MMSVPRNISSICGPSADLTRVYGDVLDLEKVKEQMEGCDLVFHTAAIADIDEARRIPITTMKVNVVGTTTCLEAARIAGVKRFLLASSVYTTGNRGSFYRIRRRPVSPSAVPITRSSGSSIPFSNTEACTAGRPTTGTSSTMFAGPCSPQVSNDYTSSPDTVREYIHISDAARESVRIGMSPEFANKSVLITGHQRLKMREFFEMVQEIMGSKITINYAPPEKQQHYVITPYSFETDIPVRVNLSKYVDISEGILDCLREVEREVHEKPDDETG